MGLTLLSVVVDRNVDTVIDVHVLHVVDIVSDYQLTCLGSQLSVLGLKLLDGETRTFTSMPVPTQTRSKPEFLVALFTFVIFLVLTVFATGRLSSLMLFEKRGLRELLVTVLAFDDHLVFD